MLKFKAFMEYIDEYRQVRENQLLAAMKAREDWMQTARSQVKSQRLINIVPEQYRRGFGCYSLWDVSNRSQFVETDSYVAVLDIYTIDSKDYKVVLAVDAKDARGYDRWRMKDKAVEELDEHNKFLADRKISKTDYAQVEGRSAQWCMARAIKDAENHRKSIEQKVQKIVGEVTEILEDVDGWYLNGSNGKRCHLWFIYAGGYNIQCLHTRCLVKEVKL